MLHSITTPNGSSDLAVVSISQDRRQLAVATKDKCIEVLDANSKELQQRIHSPSCNCVSRKSHFHYMEAKSQLFRSMVVVHQSPPNHKPKQLSMATAVLSGPILTKWATLCRRGITFKLLKEFELGLFNRYGQTWDLGVFAGFVSKCPKARAHCTTAEFWYSCKNLWEMKF
jgi:hypothetical protein